MVHTAEVLRQVLVPFLLLGGTLLTALMTGLVVQRAIRERKYRRRQRLLVRYRPLVDAVTHAGPTTPHALEQLRWTPSRHRRVIAELLLAPLRAARGDVVSRTRDAAAALGFLAGWHADLRDRRWWLRADGVRAFGFVEEPSALSAVIRALDDPHDEVRAAAVEAVGRLGDPDAIPALLGLLGDARHHRSRVIDALRRLGPTVTPHLVALAHAHPDRRRAIAEVIGLIGTAEAIDPLLTWCCDHRDDVRGAALGALGSIGLDDRSYYFALRALGDSDPHARAMAARALGRAGRTDAVGHLAQRLDADWSTAAHAAAALRQLGGAGLTALHLRAAEDSQAGDLARQMLWSR